MKAVIGLGNPGAKYQGTRHNVGYLAINELIAKMKNEKFKIKNIGSKFFADIYMVENKEKVILAKPNTFMNESGKAVSAILKFYKIKPIDLTVVSDDIDMALGKIRERDSGTSGGHRGLDSIINTLGTDKFTRIKIGIGRSDKIAPEKWVLQKFSIAESSIINQAIDQVVELISIKIHA